MRMIIFTFFIFILTINTLFPQRAYPLKIGNTWVYNNYPGTKKYTVVDDSVMIDSVYYYHINYQNDGNHQAFSRYCRRVNDFYRLRLRGGLEGQEEIYYRQGAYVGEVWDQPYDSLSYTEVLDSSLANVLGQLMIVRRLEVNSYNLLVRNYEFFTEEIGYLARIDFWGYTTQSILGCLVNGIVYGDTSFYLTNVNNIIEPVEEFRLHQNYPNPFNPSTTIKFELPQSSLVSLKVYDVLGNEVATLVKDELTAGIHSVEFNAESFPSGTYFYRLQSNIFASVKKMLLLK